MLTLNTPATKEKPTPESAVQCFEYVTQYAEVENSARYHCEFKLSELEYECIEKTKNIRIVEKYGSWADFRDETLYGVPKMLYSVRSEAGKTNRTDYTYESDGRLKNWRGRTVGETYLEWNEKLQPTRGVLNLFGGPPAIGNINVPFSRAYGKNSKDTMTKYDLRDIDLNIFPGKKLPKILESRVDEDFGLTAFFWTYSDNSRKTRIRQVLTRNRICR